jgi:hypothetical protein
VGKSKSAAARKSEKVRLTKQQKIQVGRMIRLENRISVCREYIQLWSRFFQFFAEDLRERPIKPEEEKAFFQALTLLAHKHFLFNELMGDTFSGGEKILDVLVRATSLNAIKQMDEGSLSKFELEWHSLFLDMNVALGRLLRLMPAGMKINEMLAHAEAVAKGGKAPDAKKAKKAKKGAEVEQGA